MIVLTRPCPWKKCRNWRCSKLFMMNASPFSTQHPIAYRRWLLQLSWLSIFCRMSFYHCLDELHSSFVLNYLMCGFKWSNFCYIYLLFVALPIIYFLKTKGSKDFGFQYEGGRGVLNITLKFRPPLSKTSVGQWSESSDQQRQELVIVLLLRQKDSCWG